MCIRDSRYGYEDTDTIGTKSVFNASDSKVFCYIRDYMQEDLAALFLKLESQLAWSANRVITKVEAEQALKPERLWIKMCIRDRYIPFKLKRYWDGIDLMDMYIQIHYVNKGKEEDYSTPINVRYNNEYIIFGWLISGNVTAVEGDVEFEIIARGSNEHSDTYTWKTRPNGKLNILKSLAGNGIIEPSTDWYTSFVKSMQLMKMCIRDSIKTISWSTLDGTMTMTLYRFLESFSYEMCIRDSNYC